MIKPCGLISWSWLFWREGCIQFLTVRKENHANNNKLLRIMIMARSEKRATRCCGGSIDLIMITNLWQTRSTFIINELTSIIQSIIIIIKITTKTSDDDDHHHLDHCKDSSLKLCKNYTFSIQETSVKKLIKTQTLNLIVVMVGQHDFTLKRWKKTDVVVGCSMFVHSFIVNVTYYHNHNIIAMIMTM